jgi:tetratricopeptide (TPR) repeat protein
VAAFAAQRAGKLVGAVVELFRGACDALLGYGWDIACQRSVVENDRHRRGGEPALFRHIANRDHRILALVGQSLKCRTAEIKLPIPRALIQCGGWPTLQQRVRPVSSAHIRLKAATWLVLAGVAAAMMPQSSSPEAACKPRNAAPGAASGANASPAQLFQAGQDALNGGRLDEAERDFRQVLGANPQLGGAYANLGVVYMRRKQWEKALVNLRRAEHLMPQVAGIRLNMGLAYYRQNEFLKAVPFFESVVKNQPDATQPRYLLGLCYFFADRWTDAANTLVPLWGQESSQLSYLYVLSIAAHRAGLKDLDEKATAQLIAAGEGSPEFHLFMGKAHLNLEQYDLALADFQAAAQANPKLTFVHFNLGLAYLKKQDYERARGEFLKDATVEPELALNYDELGDVYSLMQQDSNAEKSYRKALLLDPRLVNSYVGLAKAYQREEKYQQALSAIDSAVKLNPDATNIHYVRGQALIHMGRKEEGKKELETSVRIDNERRARREQQVESGTVPAPELPQPELLQDDQ